MPFVALCALLAATPTSDLEARFALAKTDDVRFELGQGWKPQDNIEPPDCTHGGPLCDINWKSAPALVTPLYVDIGNAKVLLRSKRGDPLIAVAPGRVIVALSQQPKKVGFSLFSQPRYRAAHLRVRAVNHELPRRTCTVFGLCAINQSQVGNSEQNNRDTLHLLRHDSGKLRAPASSNSVRFMVVLIGL